MTTVSSGDFSTPPLSAQPTPAPPEWGEGVAGQGEPRAQQFPVAAAGWGRAGRAEVSKGPEMFCAPGGRGLLLVLLPFSPVPLEPITPGLPLS